MLIHGSVSVSLANRMTFSHAMPQSLASGKVGPLCEDAEGSLRSSHSRKTASEPLGGSSPNLVM